MTDCAGGGVLRQIADATESAVSRDGLNSRGLVPVSLQVCADGRSKRACDAAMDSISCGAVHEPYTGPGPNCRDGCFVSR